MYYFSITVVKLPQTWLLLKQLQENCELMLEMVDGIHVPTAIISKK